MPPERTILRWSAYEHDHVERSADWFWALGIVAVCAALVSVLFHDVLFAILIIMAAVTLALLARTRPEIAEFELTRRGIRINDEMHRFEEILAFWVEEHGVERPLLLVDTTKFMAPNLIIPIEGIDPHEVREFLAQYKDEVPMKEPFAHKLLEFFGL